MTSRYPDVRVRVLGYPGDIVSVPHEIAHRLRLEDNDIISEGVCTLIERQLRSLIAARTVRAWALFEAAGGPQYSIMSDCPECAGTGNSATARTGLCSICVDPYQGNKGRPHDMAG